MLLTVSEFREAIHSDRPALIAELQSATGRTGAEEQHAWDASLPALASALAAPSLGALHVYFAGRGYISLEYQLPAASSWCDVVLLGHSTAGPSAVIVELKHWITRGDRPGPAEGLMERGGVLELHPADQVRGYTEYCRRFHSTVQDHRADVRGCVLFTRDPFVQNYAEPPNDTLVRDYPCFTMAPQVVREAWPTYLARTLNTADEQFARAFVAGRYRQDRGFVRQIGAQIRDRANSPFELLDHQRRAFAMVRARLESAVLDHGAPRKQVIVIQGPPGSGKSVLAARIWSALVTDERLPEGAAVVTTTSTAQTSNWSKLFQIASDARGAAGVVKRAASYVPVTTHTLGRLRSRHGADFASDPNAWRDNVQLLRNWGVPFQDGASDEQYLVSVVDEAHALINPEHSEGRGQFGFAPTFGPLAWHIIRCSTVSIFLLDAEQGFRDRENTTLADIHQWAEELGAEVCAPISLEGAQFRCAGSADYVAWVDGLLRGAPPSDLPFLRGDGTGFSAFGWRTPRLRSRCTCGSRPLPAAPSGFSQVMRASGERMARQDRTRCRMNRKTSTNRTWARRVYSDSGARYGTLFPNTAVITPGSYRRRRAARCTRTRSAKSAARMPYVASTSTISAYSG